jgi:hypothetical protein
MRNAMHDIETSVYEGGFRAFVAAIFAIVFISCYGADAASALRIGAHVALIYSLSMMISANGRSSGAWASLRGADASKLRFAEFGCLLAIVLQSASEFA